MSTVGWTNQSDGAFAVRRLMVQCHLLIGQDILSVMLLTITNIHYWWVFAKYKSQSIPGLLNSAQHVFSEKFPNNECPQHETKGKHWIPKAKGKPVFLLSMPSVFKCKLQLWCEKRFHCYFLLPILQEKKPPSMNVCQLANDSYILSLSPTQNHSHLKPISWIKFTLKWVEKKPILALKP